MAKARRISLALLIYLVLAALLALIATAAASTDNEVVGENNDDDTDNSNELLLQEGNENIGKPNIAERGPGSSSRSSSQTSAHNAASYLRDPSLDENSVVLITGAAGFVGSELALALRRTYRVKKLLLVDNLGIDSENESAYVPPSPGSPPPGRAVYEKCTEEELSMFEIKRQRAFRIFHELTAASLDEYDDDEEEDVARRDYDSAESVRFYRADMRPSIPEFFNFGEVPLLEGIFQSHPDVTHVVHLADVPVSSQNQAIPRNKDSVKTGPMEGLLEEMRLILERAAASSDATDAHLPQFVYASSHEVYDAISAAPNNGKSTTSQPQQPNPPPFREDKPITTPSSLHGTAKLIDEVLASAYHSTHGIYSVGLRFFSVYGPWNSPGTEVFDLAEHVAALHDETIVVEDYPYDEDVKDYVFIDDAVDAIMSAMQYRPPGNDPPPVVFNVGTGKGSTLKEVREEMERHYPELQTPNAQRSAKAASAHAQRQPTQSYASPSRSESLLGFRAQMPLSEGLAHTLAWHRDRAYPYGRDPFKELSLSQQSMDSAISDSLAKAVRSGGYTTESSKCSPLDRECLRGAPVFPCASECSRRERCTPSAWDDVAALSKMVTTGCDAVLYTILLEDDAEKIPSAAAAMADSLPYVGAGLPEDVGKRTQARCNIALVSDRSPLVRRLQSEGEEYLDEDSFAGGGSGSGLPPLLRHGFWTVLPVPTPSDSDNSSSWMHAFDGNFALKYLPKVSPGRFLGSSVRYAIYAAPSVFIKNVPELLKRMDDGPPAVPNTNVEYSATAGVALMLSEKRPLCDPAQRGGKCASTWTRPAKNDGLQSRAYNMIRVALRGDMLGGGLEPVVDSSLLVHSLGEEDSRLFRCDVYGESAQWGASSDERALEFIVSLHDLWSRAVSHWTGLKIWWNENGTAAENEDSNNDKEEDASVEEKRRQLATETANGNAKNEQQTGKWMGILSSTEMQLFTNIVSSESLGIVHLDE